MIFGAIAALAFPPVNALPLFAVGVVGADLGGGDGGAPPVGASRSAGGGASAIAWPAIFWIANSFLIDPLRFGWMVPPVIAGLAAYMAMFSGARRRWRPGIATHRRSRACCCWPRRGPSRNGCADTCSPASRGISRPMCGASTRPMMQSAALWGAWGLSFVTILLCGLLSLMGRGSRRQDCPRRRRVRRAAAQCSYGFGAGGWRASAGAGLGHAADHAAPGARQYRPVGEADRRASRPRHRAASAAQHHDAGARAGAAR